LQMLQLIKTKMQLSFTHIRKKKKCKY